jgi:serine/threonine protein kinase
MLITHSDMKVGDRIKDRFEILHILGEGATSTVFLGRLLRHTRYLPVNAQVAIKHYKSWVLEKPNEVARIARELATGKRFSHPNLCKIYEFLESDHCLIMQYVPGQTLHTYIQQNQPLSGTRYPSNARTTRAGSRFSA